jgi:hypothetical protein
MKEKDASKQSNDAPAVAETPTRSGAIAVWVYAWIGTALGGGAFGLVQGLRGAHGSGADFAIAMGIFGLVVGCVYAQIAAVPVVLTTATACWALGLRPIRPLLAILAGGLTGVVATAAFGDDELIPRRLAVAAVAGAAGSAMAMAVWKMKYRRAAAAAWGWRGLGAPSIRSRLLRLSAFAALMAVWAGLFHWYEQSQAAEHRRVCQQNLETIAEYLHRYVQTHKSLPPAHLTNKDGLGVLSWRVCAMQFSNYLDERLKNLDLSKPWDDPATAKLLGFYSIQFRCPASLRERHDRLTDYVAVVGPDTLWPGTTPGDPKKHPKAILVVEWPENEIPWAQPRDISVEEFLDWFRTKPPLRSPWDWLCARPAAGDGFHCGGLLYVDAEGNVGQLPRDTDPDTVRKMLAGRLK